MVEVLGQASVWPAQDLVRREVQQVGRVCMERRVQKDVQEQEQPVTVAGIV